MHFVSPVDFSSCGTLPEHGVLAVGHGTACSQRPLKLDHGVRSVGYGTVSGMGAGR